MNSQPKMSTTKKGWILSTGLILGLMATVGVSWATYTATNSPGLTGLLGFLTLAGSLAYTGLRIHAKPIPKPEEINPYALIDRMK